MTSLVEDGDDLLTGGSDPSSGLAVQTDEQQSVVDTSEYGTAETTETTVDSEMEEKKEETTQPQSTVDSTESDERTVQGVSDATLSTQQPTEENESVLVSGLTGTVISSSSLSSQKSTENTIDERVEIVRLRNIHKTYLLGLEGVPALRGVSLTIRRGEFIVILGKSGCGKTSMLNVMGTIDKATKGDLYICGTRIAQSTTDSEVASLRLRHIGFCFQTFNLISSMTALENVELPMILSGELGSSEIRERAKKLLSDLGMGHRFDHLPAELSGGEQQRVTIARAISNEPSLLLLDEPTGDLDSKNSDLVMSILLRLNREEQMTCVFVTHDVAIKNFAHRVIHMLDGKVAHIEVIPEEVQQQTLRDLEENLKAEKKVESVKPSTEVRDPRQFYHFHRWADSHKQSKLISA